MAVTHNHVCDWCSQSTHSITHVVHSAHTQPCMLTTTTMHVHSHTSCVDASRAWMVADQHDVSVWVSEWKVMTKQWNFVRDCEWHLSCLGWWRLERMNDQRCPWTRRVKMGTAPWDNSKMPTRLERHHLNRLSITTKSSTANAAQNRTGASSPSVCCWCKQQVSEKACRAIDDVNNKYKNKQL